ncbi:zincin [Thelephora ganbajun]|uniref:Zincin n=1 Tax=Thelephora ganbajun TaxID=370292 RepID=A0ACB6ZQA3_THEGA|nr:zincin [Thelephora ganbajun]
MDFPGCAHDRSRSPLHFWIAILAVLAFGDTLGILMINAFATVEDAVEVNLSDNLAVSRIHDKQVSFNSCSPTSQPQLNTTTASVQAYAGNAYSCLADSNQFGIIYLCGALRDILNTRINFKAGTLVHESSHFTSNGGTDDYACGQTAAKDLTVSNPPQAIFNVDCHEYFVENNPTLS